MFKQYLFLHRNAGSENDRTGGGKQPTVHGEASAGDIAKWKEKHKALGVYVITVTDPRTETKGDKHKGYFRRPDFEDMNMGYAKLDRDALIDVWREFASNTWLGGSEEMLDNATLFAGAMIQIRKMVEGAESEVQDL